MFLSKVWSAENRGAKYRSAKYWDANVCKCKIWDAKGEGTKCGEKRIGVQNSGGAKCGAQSVERKVWGANYEYPICYNYKYNFLNCIR